MEVIVSIGFSGVLIAIGLLARDICNSLEKIEKAIRENP